MSKDKKPKGFTPSPFFTSWWGLLAERVWRVAPLKRKLSSRSKIPHKKQKDKTPHEKCPCEAFTMCDTYYQNMDPIVKDAWKFCVKKPGMSGYGLWMKECLCLLIAGYNFPATCSASGGYNCISVEPGDEEPPLEGFIGQATVRYRCIGDPTWECQPSPSGAYGTLEACEVACQEPPPENTCNDCDPALPDIFVGECHGLSGDFAPAQGPHNYSWVTDCRWDASIPPIETAKIQWVATWWEFLLDVKPLDDCLKKWRSNFGYPCHPWNATFSESRCDDQDCTDPDSCPKSSGATAAVYLS